MKKISIAIIASLITNAALTQTVTISEQASQNIQILSTKLTGLEQQAHLKEIILSTTKLALQLPKKDADILLNSEYFLNAKKQMKEIIKTNTQALEETQAKL